jgi:hypothetical protein
MAFNLQLKGHPLKLNCMKNIFLFVLISTSAIAFEKPNLIQCENTATIKVKGNGSIKSYYKKELNIKLDDAAILEFIVGNKSVAKLYPQDGIDYVILDKSYKTQTDNKSFWKLKSKSSQQVFYFNTRYSCI